MKITMTKILAVLLALLLVVAVVGCNKDEQSESQETSQSSSESSEAVEPNTGESESATEQAPDASGTSSTPDASNPSGTSDPAGTSNPTGTSEPAGTSNPPASSSIPESSSPAAPIEVTGVSFATNAATVGVGKTLTIAASVTPTNATDKSITYTSSNTTVATVTSAGVVKGVKAGTATITATSANKKTATVKVTVTGAAVVEVTSIALESTSLTIDAGKTAYIKASVVPTNATNKYLEYIPADFNIVKCDETGKVTAKAVGTTTITVRSDNGKTATVTVKVTGSVEPTGVGTFEEGGTLKVGDTYQLECWVNPGTATNKTLTYSSSNTAVATVGTKGLVTAKAAGTVKITVSTYNGFKEVISFTVEDNNPPTAERLSASEIIDGIVKYTNKARVENGLPELQVDDVLMECAAERAKELNTSFSHTRPNGNQFYFGSFYCENILASGRLVTPERNVEVWMESSGHRKNILDSKAKYIGIGCYILGDGPFDTVYLVQMFRTEKTTTSVYTYPESVTLDQYAVTLKVGESVTITATVKPFDESWFKTSAGYKDIWGLSIMMPNGAKQDYVLNNDLTMTVTATTPGVMSVEANCRGTQSKPCIITVVE